MIAGPGIHWYRGDGPMPDLDALEIPVSITAPIRAARVSKRLPPNPRSTPTQQNTATQVRLQSPHQPHRTPRQCRARTWRTAHHTPQPPRKRRTKGVQLFRNPLKPAHPGEMGGNGDRARIKDLYSSNPGSGVEARDGGKKEKGDPMQVAVGSSQTGRSQPIMCRPPLAVTVCPVMKFDSSERRKRAKLAISSA